MSEPKPCPFCGHVGLDFREGSTFRWIVAECSGCGASRGETRIQTLGDGTKDEWMDDAKEDAIREWNRRAAVQAAQPEAVGWKLVPVEPTPAMLVAMWDHRESMRGQSENRIARAGYAAMLMAAPTPEPMSAPTADPMTKDELDMLAKGMCDRGELVWAGFRQDADGFYTIPDTSPNMLKLVNAARALATPPSAATPEPSDAERAKGRNCPACKHSDSWGIPDRSCALACVPTLDGQGTSFEPLNATKGGKL